MSTEARAPVLQLQNIHVAFDDVAALKGIDLDLYPGELHAVVGERRSGKSSIVRVLSGEVTPSRGKIVVAGQESAFLTPQSSFGAGIGIVHQYPNTISSLTVIQNIYAGRGGGRLLQPKLFRSLRARCNEVFSLLGVAISLDAPTATLSSSQREMVEIARALLFDPLILVLDEVSSRLNVQELDTLFHVLSDRKRGGGGILYIAPNLDEVFTIADRVTLLKDGTRKGTESVHDMDRFRVLQLAYNFIFNVSPEEKADKELFLVELFNETLISDLPLGIIILTASGRIAMTNKATRKILGIRQKDLQGSEVDILFSTAGTEKRADIAERIRGRERHTWSKLKLDADKFIKLKTFPMRNENMDFIGTILMLEDVSMDHFVREYLLRAEKITSVAELAAGVAHEINNPLGIINNYVVLLKSLELGQEARENLDKIENELARIVDTIGSLLSYSRSQQNTVRNIDMAVLVEETATLLSHRLREKSIVLTRRALDSVLVPGDENKLKQLLINLILNSVEAVLERGSIAVVVERAAETGEAVVTIADDGCGIPPEIAESVFTPFFTTKMSKKNIGLGLSICQNIVESHGGSISFSSEPGKGTTFVVRLPSAR